MRKRYFQWSSIGALLVRRAERPLHDFRLPLPLPYPVESLEALQAERSDRPIREEGTNDD